jgi:tripartite-type tricarboxylate transporter receptor subunit TctC
MTFTHWFRAAVAAVLAAVLCGGVAAQPVAFPNKPIKFILPFGPGSGTDLIARIIGDEMTRIGGQPVIIDYKPGANGFIAAEATKNSAPDGYTVMIGGGTTHSINPLIFKKLPYDPDKDLPPLSGMILAYYTLLVNKDLPVNTVQELIAWLKANSQKASYAWGASISRFISAGFLDRIGVTNAVSVPYKSSPQTVTDLIGGQFTFTILDITSALAHIKAGRVKSLAVTAPHRIAALADIPTMAEAGLPGFTGSTYVGMFGVGGTPEPMIQAMNELVQKALATASVKDKLTACCSAVTHQTSSQGYLDYIIKDRASWAEKMALAGVKPE